MVDHLQGSRILVVEDEYYVALQVEQELSEAGAVIIGPVPSVDAALAMIDRAHSIDAAMLDINLNGQEVFTVADRLMAEGVPFLFSTGYGEQDIPTRYAHVPRIEKPIQQHAITAAIRQMLTSA